MTINKKTILILKIASSALILILLFNQFGEEAVKSFEKVTSISGILFLAVGLALHFGEKFLRVFNFKLLLLYCDAIFSYLHLLKITLTSAFYGFFIPGAIGPDLVRIQNLKQDTQNYSQPTAATLLLNVITITSAALICLLGISFMMFNDESFPRSLAYSILASSATILLLCLVGINSKFQKLLMKLLCKISLPFTGTAIRLTNKLILAVNQITRKNNLFLVMLLASLVIIIASLKIYFVSLALNLDIHIVHFLILMPLTIVFASVPISFAGIGIRESVFIFYLSAQGINAGDALVMGTLASLFNVLFALCGGLIQTTNFNKSKPKPKPNENSTHD